MLKLNVALFAPINEKGSEDSSKQEANSSMHKDYQLQKLLFI